MAKGSHKTLVIIVFYREHWLNRREKENGVTQKRANYI
jgi:hypothetical protein